MDEAVERMLIGNNYQNPITNNRSTFPTHLPTVVESQFPQLQLVVIAQ